MTYVVGVFFAFCTFFKTSVIEMSKDKEVVFLKLQEGYFSLN